MKKITLLLSVLTVMVTLSVNAQQVERELVVLEIATGTWCTYCPGAAMGADDLIANGKDVAVIEYHNGDSYTNTYGNERNSYNNVGGIPDAHFDGVLVVVGGSHTVSMYPQYLPKYNTRKAVMSSFTIDVVGETAGFSDYFTEITIEKVASSSASDIRLHLVVTESEIEENWQGMAELHFVERLMAPDQLGTALDFSDNDIQVVNLDFGIEDSWVYEHCELVVFLQDNNTHEILQGFKMPLSEFGPANDYDVALTELRDIPEGNCSGVLSPSVTIRNNSEIDLTQVDINYSVNGENLSTFQWTGSLGYLETADVDLPSVDFINQENNSTTVYTTSPNGNDDEYVFNDTLIQNFEMAMSVAETVNLVLRLDNNPEETSWEVKNSLGDVVYSGGSYTTQGENISETFELNAFECYSFAIYDTGGDGLEMPGFFILYYGNNSTILEGTYFGSMSGTEFVTGYVGIEEEIDSYSLSVFPNPFSDKTNISFSLNTTQNVIIEVYNMLGEKVSTIDKGILSQGSQVVEFDRSKLTNGVYFITMNINNRLITEKIIIK